MRKSIRLFDNSPTTEWDLYFMKIAYEVGQHSKCLSRKIGAVLVRDKSIISTGYNGPPRGVPKCWKRNPNYEETCPRYLQGYKSGEGLHLCVAGHAERNALINAARNGIATKGTSLFCYCGIPCSPCLVEIINAGVLEVVYKIDGSIGNVGEYYDDMAEYLIDNSNLFVRGVEII